MAKDPWKEMLAKSWMSDQPKPRKREPENNLVLRVAAAREMGVSYGQYMAMLRDGAIADPLAEVGNGEG